MAKNTSLSCRNLVIYSVFVRCHTPEGTFEGVRRDLPRIKALGADVIWLLPIHPIGRTARKGTLGSPYAIRDYLAVNPEYGALEDFRHLVDDIHALGMKCIIDVVYNHTSPDSVLASEHPEWFYHRADGSLGNRVGDWSDVIDLDYSNTGLWEHQINALRYWAGMVDGFRCDVAPLVPLEFWLEARAQVEKVRPGCLWLAEAVEPSFADHIRSLGYSCLSDAQLYEAFDLCYDYDAYPVFRDYLAGKLPLSGYAELLNRQEALYPDNYVKLRFLENHDQPRIASLLLDEAAVENWTAFSFFQRGAALVYAGQEAGCVHRPSLFEREPVDWTGPDRTGLLRKLCAIKKHPLLASGRYQVRTQPGDILYASYREGERQIVGVFSPLGTPARLQTELPDGRYENMIDGSWTEVSGGRLKCRGTPIIFEVCS